MPGRAGRDHAADQHADRRQQQQAGQRRVGDRHRRAMERAERHHGIVEHPAAHQGDQRKEEQVEQDRGRQQ